MRYTFLGLALLGCNSFADDDTPLFEPHPYADLYTDGANVDVVGCPTSAIIGCSPGVPTSNDHMRLIVDGDTVDVPVIASGQPASIDHAIAGLFHDGPFGLTLAAPANDRVLVAIDDAGSNITLPHPPALTASAHVSRSQMLTLHHDLVPDPSQIEVVVTTTCSDGGGGIDGEDEATPGELTIDLTRRAAATGSCTHEIHVDQIVDIAVAPALPTRAIAISKTTITSDP